MAQTAAQAVLRGQDDIRQWQEDFYRQVHQHPELGHQEVQTADAVARASRGAGFEVTEEIGSTGVVGVLRNGDGPTIMMRADMDALPVEEETGLPYASSVTSRDRDGATVPVMHACGHDVHVACLLGAARLIASSRRVWSGTYIALFQPAEELADGARRMLDGGLGDIVPPPDVVLVQHVLPLPAGTVGTRVGPVLSRGDSMRITVRGRGGHGSMPQLTVDPAVLVAAIVQRLQGVVAREIAPGEFAVLTVGRIAAGTKSNIISGRGLIELNIRAFSDDVRDTIVEAVTRIVDGECRASGSPKKADVEIFDSYPLTDNDETVTRVVARAFAAHFGDGAVELARQSASEDFSDIPSAFGAPYTYWGIGGIDPGAYAKAEAAGTVSADIPANHSPHFAPVIQPTLHTGTAAAVVAAMAWLEGDQNAYAEE